MHQQPVPEVASARATQRMYGILPSVAAGEAGDSQAT
jgi:hypothetical protein